MALELAWQHGAVVRLLLAAEQKDGSVFLPETGNLILRKRFTRCQKLLNSQDFNQVFSNTDIRVSRRNFLILARLVDAEKARLGMVISKKKVRLAVNRNRCKRIIRESFRTHQEQLWGHEIVFVARYGLDELSGNELRTALAYPWKRICQKKQKASEK